MFSVKIKSFLYGALVSISLISVAGYALGADDGVFGIYFQNMISSTYSCGSEEVITGFDESNNANYGKPRCTTFQNIVNTVLGAFGTTGTPGQAVIGFNPDGSPKYGDVNWHKDGVENLSYTGAGNVGIGMLSPSEKLHILGTVKTDTIEGTKAIEMRNTSNGGAWSWRLQGDGTSANNLHLDYVGAPDLMTLRSTGNVGIGTSTPTEKLDVAGIVSSTSGGFKFPDGTIQTTATVPGLDTIIVSDSLFGWRWPVISKACPAGYKMTGGGGTCTGGTGYNFIYVSQPLGNGWIIQCDTPNNQMLTATVSVVCSR